MSDENKMYILKEKYYHGWCQICRGLPSIKLTYQFDGIKLIEYWCDKHKDMIENGT
jgi:hypothetical protein